MTGAAEGEYELVVEGYGDIANLFDMVQMRTVFTFSTDTARVEAERERQRQRNALEAKVPPFSITLKVVVGMWSCKGIDNALSNLLVF